MDGGVAGAWHQRLRLADPDRNNLRVCFCACKATALKWQPHSAQAVSAPGNPTRIAEKGFWLTYIVAHNHLARSPTVSNRTARVLWSSVIETTAEELLKAHPLLNAGQPKLAGEYRKLRSILFSCALLEIASAMAGQAFATVGNKRC